MALLCAVGFEIYRKFGTSSGISALDTFGNLLQQKVIDRSFLMDTKNSMFKVRFPSGYVINNIEDDNIDINVYTPNGNIYFATLFTLKNISRLMNKDSAPYFWSDSMIVVEDLEKKTIKAAITKIIEDSYLNSAFSYIGVIEGESSVYASYSGIVSDI